MSNNPRLPITKLPPEAPEEDYGYSAAPGPDEIAERAYQMWVERGSPIGSPDEDWYRAEQELLQLQA